MMVWTLGRTFRGSERRSGVRSSHFISPWQPFAIHVSKASACGARVASVKPTAAKPDASAA